MLRGNRTTKLLSGSRTNIRLTLTLREIIGAIRTSSPKRLQVTEMMTSVGYEAEDRIQPKC
jgi:hypothetical protein